MSFCGRVSHQKLELDTRESWNAIPISQFRFLQSTQNTFTHSHIPIRKHTQTHTHTHWQQQQQHNKQKQLKYMRADV